MSRACASFPAVTVLMPVYNGARFLREQVESILAQRSVLVRLVILDDGSTDNSYGLARELAGQDERVTLAERRPNTGLIGAFTRLLRFVQTPYFAMSDQDDIWDEDKLVRSVDHLNATGVALVYSDVRLCDEQGVITELSYMRSRRLAPLEGTDPVASIFRNPVLGHTIVARREVAEVASDPPATLRYYEPWLVAAACRHGGVAMVPAQLGRYRIHDRNVVGPGRRGHVPGVGVAGMIAHLTRRQTNRSTALQATAHLWPDLQPLAAAYDVKGLSRLIASLGLIATLQRRCPEIGIAHILREALLLLVWPRTPTSGS